jgi:hypothetical protein
MNTKIGYLLGIFFLVNVESNAQFAEINKAEAAKQNEITLIPDPVLDEIRMTDAGSEFSEYLIYDMYGKRVKQGWFLNSFSVKSLEPGRYFLTIISKDQTIKKEFLKLKPEDKIGMVGD